MVWQLEADIVPALAGKLNLLRCLREIVEEAVTDTECGKLNGGVVSRDSLSLTLPLPGSVKDSWLMCVECARGAWHIGQPFQVT